MERRSDGWIIVDDVQLQMGADTRTIDVQIVDEMIVDGKGFVDGVTDL